MTLGTTTRPLLVGAFLLASFVTCASADSSAGAVYVMSNEAAGNSVMVFYRATDGLLASGGTFAAGGAGTGIGLGSQGALALSDDHRFLYAVNAGSDSISTFAVTDSGLEG